MLTPAGLALDTKLATALARRYAATVREGLGWPFKNIKLNML